MTQIMPTEVLPQGGTSYPAAFQFPWQDISASGAITIPCGVVVITKATAAAITLAAPATNGQVLFISSNTAAAHTVTITAGVNGQGAGADVGTFSAAIGNYLILGSYGGNWCQLANLNVTWG